MKHIIFSIFIVMIISGCSSSPKSRYQQKHDSIPTRLPTAVELVDPKPRVVPKSRGGNKHYSVRGKSYNVLPNAKGFTQTGVASWYGKKFHGHLTSNGEIYDMYAMSAAHKNLPIPTYAKVTNVANNKSVIVRVNDRGPFHHSRVIDLSYSAAYKLDMLKTGTAMVDIVAITEDNIHLYDGSTPKTSKKTVVAAPAKQKQVINPSTKDKGYYIQAFATKSLANAKKAQQLLAANLNEEINYPYRDGIFRVFVGPISTDKAPDKMLEQVKTLGYPSAYIKKSLK